jgi:hypothetical protein
MHFEFTVTLGQLLIVLSLVGGFFKLYRPFAQRQWEHDLMWDDYAERKGMGLSERVAPKYRARGAAAGRD